MVFLYLAIISTLIGLIPMPYVGYTFVRIGVTLGCALAIFTIPKKTYAGISSTVWLVIISILYNPIIPLFLNRGTWIILDLVVAAILFGIVSADNATITNPNEVKTIISQSRAAKGPLNNKSNSKNKETSREFTKLIEKKGDESANSFILYGIVILIILALIKLSFT
jgi:hypothetical protein